MNVTNFKTLKKIRIIKDETNIKKSSFTDYKYASNIKKKVQK